MLFLLLSVQIWRNVHIRVFVFEFHKFSRRKFCPIQLINWISNNLAAVLLRLECLFVNENVRLIIAFIILDNGVKQI